MRQTQSIIVNFLVQFSKVPRIETTPVQAGAEAPEASLEHVWDATRFEHVFILRVVGGRLYSSSSDSLSDVTVTRNDLLAIWGLPNRFSVTSS